jgi:hypothetical protein
MNYTHHWNSEFIKNVTQLNLSKSINLGIEIGCFEGLTSNYIVDNLLTPSGKLICIDPLMDSYLNNNLSHEHKTDNEIHWTYFKNQYERFISNTKSAINSNKLELYRHLSSEIFPKLLNAYSNKIDFIYVDGDHRAEYIYIDAINSFKLCKSGGIILFDDYGWKSSNPKENTKIGIDKFIYEYSNKCTVILKNYQLAVTKL